MVEKASEDQMMKSVYPAASVNAITQTSARWNFQSCGRVAGLQPNQTAGQHQCTSRSANAEYASQKQTAPKTAPQQHIDTADSGDFAS